MPPRGPDRTPNLLSPLIYFHSGSTFNDRPVVVAVVFVVCSPLVQRFLVEAVVAKHDEVLSYFSQEGNFCHLSRKSRGQVVVELSGSDGLWGERASFLGRLFTCMPR